MPLNEADTCRLLILPRLQRTGWETSPHSIAEQRSFTDGRIVVLGSQLHRRKRKRADYLLRYTQDFPLAVVEAKPEDHTPGSGLQQAKEYAEILGLQFAYATNGHGIVEFDYRTGLERELDEFPTPHELWARFTNAETITPAMEEKLLEPFKAVAGKTPRYYQRIAINRAVQAILQGKRRVLLTMATGTGKTFVAFQICWKLWNAKWNTGGTARRPRILFLADRNILVDDPKDKMFTPFGDARHKIENGEVITSREMYFAIYQAIAKDSNRPGLFKEFAPDFFDLVIIDECHRGSARDDSNWRDVLNHFSAAVHLGMTATPLRDDNRGTYHYFGNPVYTYSLRQGIEDGFLAPYRVHRIVTTVDAVGWRPVKGEVDRFGHVIPDGEYSTRDFERTIALRQRTEAMARHFTEFLKKTDRFAKSIMFCVDQEHADAMRHALAVCNADLMQAHPDYVCRVTSDEGDIGKGCLSRFQDVETRTPVILTTSKLLTTGVDMPMCKNIVLATVIGSMTEFKQIIGRGTRLQDEYGKLYFNILDYTGTATRHFADPDFDGEPAAVVEGSMDEEGNAVEETVVKDGDEATAEEAQRVPTEDVLSRDDDRDNNHDKPRKYYVDGGQVAIAAHLVYELDAEGRQLRMVRFTDYTAEKVRTLFATAHALRQAWLDQTLRGEIEARLAELGITFEALAAQLDQPEADPLDLLCHLAFNAPLRTRRERAERVQAERTDFFDTYGPEARTILNELLEHYAVHGPRELALPDVLKLPPISTHGTVAEIARLFHGPERLRDAVLELQRLLYAA